MNTPSISPPRESPFASVCPRVALPDSQALVSGPRLAIGVGAPPQHLIKSTAKAAP